MELMVGQLLGSKPAAEARVLVLAPHPDDEIFGCGGTLALLNSAGAAIRCIIATDGVARSPDPVTTRECREAESTSAARSLGLASPIFWGLPDGQLASDEDLIARVVDAAKDWMCDLILAPSAFERHPDHFALSLAATAAARQLGGDLRLAFYEVGEPLCFNALIDIGSVLDQKRLAMRCFESELKLQAYDAQIEGLNVYRAYTLSTRSVKAAEAFLVVSAKSIDEDLPIFSSESESRRILSQLDGEARQARHDSQLWADRYDDLQACYKALQGRQTEIERELLETTRVRDWVLNSRSWRLTAPLRGAVVKGREFRALAMRVGWKVALAAYRFKPTGTLIAALPVGLKRRVRDMLIREQGVAKSPPVFRLRPETVVSLVIPVYNHAEFVEAAIDSALAQTYPNLEVIVVDDASPDPRVAEILQRLNGHPRLKILQNETNLGISRTQNRALQASSGDIIGFLDCDDLLEPDAVACSLRYWSDETIYSHSSRINVDDEGNELARISFEHLPRRDYFEENLAAMYATHFKMIRRDAFAKVGLFDPRFDAAQDYDILMRVAFHYPSSAFEYVPHFVYRHRLHVGQTTEKQNDRQTLAARQIQQEAVLRRNIRNGSFDKFLSIIMLSFGKHSQTLQAVESLRQTVRVPHEIILFDNGSDAETVEFLKDNIEGRFPNVRVFYSDSNLGPAAGRREALKQAQGDWFIVFDNDEIAEPGWLEELLVRAASDDKIGSVTCKVIFPNRALQCCGGYIESGEDDVIHLELIGRGLDVNDLAVAEFRDCDWCPIGATLFTINPAPFLHAGYPNVFEDAGVSMALRRAGYRLVNSPASWVWHEHVTFRREVEMGERYTSERYNPQRMLLSVASFYKENGQIIFDEYVWRENGLAQGQLPSVRARLESVYQAFEEAGGPTGH